MESNSAVAAGSEPLENRLDENDADSHETKTEVELKSDLNPGEDVIDDLDDEEVKGGFFYSVTAPSDPQQSKGLLTGARKNLTAVKTHL